MLLRTDRVGRTCSSGAYTPSDWTGQQYPRDRRTPRRGRTRTPREKMSTPGGGKSFGAAYHTRNSAPISLAQPANPSHGNELRRRAHARCLPWAASGEASLRALFLSTLRGDSALRAKPKTARCARNWAYGPGWHLGRRRPGPFFFAEHWPTARSRSAPHKTLLVLGVRAAGLRRGLSQLPLCVPPGDQRMSLHRCSSRLSSPQRIGASPRWCGPLRTSRG